MSSKPVEQLDRVIIRFAGDSGDGMQLTGDRFTSETALMGNDLATLPDFPAEIRAPAGSLPGVSGFQVHFADHDIFTPGDQPNVLVAMNPAALKTNLADLPKGGMLIVNTDAFNDRNLQKAGYEASPLTDGSLEGFHVHEVALTSMTVEALKEVDGITSREAERSKNFFALGLMLWLYHRPTEGTLAFIEEKFGKKPAIADANTRAFKAGYNYGETSEDFAVSYEIAPAHLAPGRYRQITGNTAISYGLIAASKLSGLPLFLGAYPITPASSILEELARHKNFGVTTFQAEDEIAACGAALGASFGGALGVTTSAGPGIVLKAEMVGLGVMLELPLLVLDIQRAGPSTGMPTKPEQADLLMVLFGRNGESPVPVDRRVEPLAVLPRRDRGCPDRAQVPHPCLPAVGCGARERLRALADPRRRRAAVDRDRRSRRRRTRATSSTRTSATPRRSHAPGRCRARRASSTGSAGSRRRTSPARSPTTPTTTTGWSACAPRRWRTSPPTSRSSRSTTPTARRGRSCSAGARPTARSVPPCDGCGASGHKVASAHLHHLNPFPRNMGDVLRRYDKVLVPEMNTGQLLQLIRREFLVDAVGYNRVRGLPFRSSELAEAITAHWCEGRSSGNER